LDIGSDIVCIYKLGMAEYGNYGEGITVAIAPICFPTVPAPYTRIIQLDSGDREKLDFLDSEIHETAKSPELPFSALQANPGSGPGRRLNQVNSISYRCFGLWFPLECQILMRP
jgi:hypothetical protein